MAQECVNCGKKLKSDMAACPSCGQKVGGKLSKSNVKNTASKKKLAAEKAQKQKKLFIILFIVVCALLVCGIAFYFIYSAVINYNEDLETYNTAVSYIEQEELNQAEIEFDKLNDENFKDSKEKIKDIRTAKVDKKLAIYDHVGAERYALAMEDGAFKNLLLAKICYETGLLHEGINPYLAATYFEKCQEFGGSYPDVRERTEKNEAEAAEEGQNSSSFADTQIIANGEAYYFLVESEHDTFEEAEAAKDAMADLPYELTPFIKEYRGKYLAAAAEQSTRIFAETRRICLSKLGIETEIRILRINETPADTSEIPA